jgi:hypothetical protein
MNAGNPLAVDKPCFFKNVDMKRGGRNRNFKRLSNFVHAQDVVFTEKAKNFKPFGNGKRPCDLADDLYIGQIQR